MWENNEEKHLQESANFILGENQLQKYGQFLFNYTKKCHDIEHTRMKYPQSNKTTYIKIKLSDTTEDADSIHDEHCMDENETIVQLVSSNTENVIYNKLIIVFAHLSKEIKFILKELRRKYFNFLLYYGEQNTDNSSSDLLISKSLKKLLDLSNLIKFAYKIFAHTIKQLNSVYFFQWNNRLVSDNLCMFDIFMCVGELLMNFVVIDEILVNQLVFKDHWNQYKQNVIDEIQSQSSGAVGKNDLKGLLGLLNYIEKTLLSGKVFSNALHLKFVEFKKNIKLSASILNFVKLNLAKFEQKQLSELTYEKCQQFTKVCHLYVFYVNTCGLNDRKLFQKMWECFKKFTFTTIYSNIVWCPDEFFKKHINVNISNFIDKKSLNSIAVIRENYISQAHENLHKEVNIYTIYVVSWLIRFEDTITKDISHMKLNEIKQMINVVLDGINLSGKIKRVLTNITNLYYTLNKPIVKTNVINICKLIELLKYIETSFRNNHLNVCKILNKLSNFLMYQSLVIVGNMKKTLNINKHVDVLTSLVLIEKLLKGSFDELKLTIIKQSLAFVNKTIVKEDELNCLSKTINQLNMIVNFETIIQSNCNVCFLYFHKNLLSIYIKHNKNNVYLKYICEIINDLCEVNNKEKSIYLKEIEAHIVQPLCTEIETNLRLHSHLHLQVDKLSLDKVNNNVNHTFLLNPNLISLSNEIVDVKYEIENYLDKTFYDLTTIALHNYKTYNEMRNIAKYKFELNVVRNNLPSKTLDNGIDLLFIIRNINYFINNYNYNINNQIFIENKSNNKFLNTVSIYHIANNIRVYGMGIISTIINYIYQYLCKKLNTLIKYLYDENIKSKLIKEIKFYRENKAKFHQKYPFESAEKLLKVLKGLVIPDPDEPEELANLNYLEKFRVVITQIGNAIGLIRMIRTGSLHYCANSVQFLPTLNNIDMVEDLIQKHEASNNDKDVYNDTTISTSKANTNQSQMTDSNHANSRTNESIYTNYSYQNGTLKSSTHQISETTLNCLSTFDLVMKKSINNLQDSTDYFKLLTNAFKPLLKNTNIRHFYMMIPSLTLYYVQCMIKMKEKLSKLKTAGANTSWIQSGSGGGELVNFTHDGFVCGLCYLMQILAVQSEYNSLHWYETVMERYAALQRMDAQHVQKSNVNNLTHQTSNLYLNQMQQFFYSFNSTQIFFQN